VRRLVGSGAEVIVDDRVLDQRAIEMLATLLVRHNGEGTSSSRRPAERRSRPPAPRLELRHGGQAVKRTKENES
jgi:hypothetical protein